MAVLSYGVWKSVLNGDESVIDRKVILRGEPYIVVGVMPASFRSVGPADVWTPLRPSTSGEGEGTTAARYAMVLATATALTTPPCGRSPRRSAAWAGQPPMSVRRRRCEARSPRRH